MKNLKLSELLRYSLAGGIALFVIILVNPKALTNVVPDGDFLKSTIGAALVMILGSLIYSVHRAILYPIIYRCFLIGFALLTWTARNAAASDALKAIVLALFVADGVGFIVALIGQLGNVVNQLGWSTVVIYLLLTLGWGYFQFSKPASSET